MEFYQTLLLVLVILVMNYNFFVTRELMQDSYYPRRAAIGITEIPINRNYLDDQLREGYIDLVVMGLLGGLTHMAELDKKMQSSSDPWKSSRCLTRDWEEPEHREDLCQVKWDGYERLMQMKVFYEKIRKENIIGDLVECGVWRGGITIMMRALLEAYDDKNRTVWVSDSFRGVPNRVQQKSHPNYMNVSSDIQEMDRDEWGKVVVLEQEGEKRKMNLRSVDIQIVQDNFRRYGLLDDQVKFLPGWFHETLPNATEHGLNKIAFLRIDGKLYSSTMDVLIHLYDSVVPGGFIYFEDYNSQQSKQAIHDFFRKHGLNIRDIKNNRVTGSRYSWKNEDLRKSMGSYFQKPRVENVKNERTR